MNKLFLLAAMIVSAPAFASDPIEVALERLAADVYTKPATADRLDSVTAYLNTLSRVGAEPTSIRGCVSSVLAGSKLGLCSPVARASGGGTGGVD